MTRQVRKDMWRAMALGLLLVIPWVEEATAGEGFGTFGKKEIQLERVRPADVYIAETRIAVRSSGQGLRDAAEQQLVSLLESQLLANDPRFELAEHPDTLIEVAVLQNEVKERWETRTVTKSVPAGKDSKGRQTYTSRRVQVKFKIVTQVFNVAYKATDQARRQVLDAGSPNHRFEKDYEEGAGAPAALQLENVAIGNAVAEIAQRLTRTTERVGVLLPGGTLKEYRNLAQAGLWDRYLESLDALPKRGKSKDESYRQYSLGVAYEALGYGAEAPETAMSYLEEASNHYNRAIELNPSEKFFARGYQGSGIFAGLKNIWNEPSLPGTEARAKEAMAPSERVRSALAQFQKLIEHRDAAASGGGSSTEILAGAKDLDGEEAMNNRAIIDMSRAGLPEAVIVTAIQGALETAFDISPTGLIELARAEVSPEIIQQIQNHASKGKK